VGWPTCLHVAGSKKVLQCLATTNKSVIVFWIRYLPLLNWIKWTLCRIVENKISLPDICCSNGKIWEKIFENPTHLVPHWDDFVQSLHMSIRQKASITQCKLSKQHLFNFVFLVSPNDKWFYSYFESSVGPSQMKNLCTSYYQNISFRNTVLSKLFQASFILLLISC